MRGGRVDRKFAKFAPQRARGARAYARGRDAPIVSLRAGVTRERGEDGAPTHAGGPAISDQGL